MKPSLGQTVIFGSTEGECAALITKVWSDQDLTGNMSASVNLTVFEDGKLPYPVSSVMLYASKEKAYGGYGACWWPDRVI